MKLDTLLGFAFMDITRLKRQYMDQQVKALGLTRTQWRIYAWLHTLGTPCPQKTLLSNIEIDAAHLARVLEQLEKKGHLTRHVPPENRRALCIELTSEGQATLQKIKHILLEEHNIMKRHLSDKQVDEFYQALAQIKQNLEATL